MLRVVEKERGARRGHARAAPGIGGEELAKMHVRVMIQGHLPYFVAMTGWSGAVKHARDAGFDHFLLKPAGREQLLHAIELAQQRKTASPSAYTGRLIHEGSHLEAGAIPTLQDAPGAPSLRSRILG